MRKYHRSVQIGQLLCSVHLSPSLLLLSPLFLVLQLFPMAEQRIGSVPLVEPAEEVRALVLRLCSALLRGKSAEIFGCEVSIFVVRFLFSRFCLLFSPLPMVFVSSRASLLLRAVPLPFSVIPRELFPLSLLLHLEAGLDCCKFPAFRARFPPYHAVVVPLWTSDCVVFLW